MDKVSHVRYSTGTMKTLPVLSRIGVGVSLLTALAGCGGSSGGGQTSTPLVQLTVSSVSPTTIPAGTANVTLSITGTGFTSSTVVQVGGVAEATTYGSSTQLTASLPAAQIAGGGLLSIAAANGSTISTSSSPVTLEVDNPVPALSGVSPSTFAVGSAGSSVTLTGTGFVPATAVTVNGASRTTTYVSSTQLNVALVTSDLATAGTLSFIAVNPSPKGGSSAPATATVNNPAPAALTLSPSIVAAGATTASTVTITGTNFLPSSTIQVGTSTRTATYVSGTQLTFALTVADQATAGKLTVTVTNPGPGGGTASATLTVATPAAAPTLTSLSPNYGPMNTATAISLLGTGFTANTVASFNGSALATTYVSATKLTVTLPASSVQLPGNGIFTVSTPAPGGGTSAGQTFSVYIPILSNKMIYNPTNGLLYASIPSSYSDSNSQPHLLPMGNSIVSVNPATGAMGTPIYVGSEPGPMALSADGLSLWVGLNAGGAVRKVNLATGTAGAQFSLPVSAAGISTVAQQVVTALVALPGTTDSVVVAQSDYVVGSSQALNLKIDIFDSGVARGTGASLISPAAVYALQADGTKNEIYADGTGLFTYTYGAGGLTAKNSVPQISVTSLSETQLISGKLYSDFGTIFDAEAGSVVGSVYSAANLSAQSATFVDAAAGKIYTVNNNSSSGRGNSFNQFQVFNLTTLAQSATPVFIGSPFVIANYNSNYVSNLVRWGANGLAFHVPFGIYSVQSNGIVDLSGSTADLGLSVAASGGTITGTTSTFTATVTNAGPSTATDVVVTLQGPSLGSLSAVTSSAGTCSTTPTITCTLGSITSGTHATITLTVLQTAAGASTVNAQVSASSPDPASANNSASTTVTVTGSPYSLVPTMTAISPATIQSGSTDTAITVTGTGFSNTSTIQLAGSSVPTTYVSPTQLMALVPAAKLTSLGWIAVTVLTPAPGGGISAAMPLSIYSLLPLGFQDMVYEPYSRTILGTLTTGTIAGPPNSIAAFNPATAQVTGGATLSGAPGQMSLSSDGQILYVLLPANTAVSRYNTISSLVEANFAGPVATVGRLTDISVMPGTENTFALEGILRTGILDYNPTTKSATLRSGVITRLGTGCLQFVDPSDLYFPTTSGPTNLVHDVVSATGISLQSETSYLLYNAPCFTVNGSLAFFNAGYVANLVSNPVTFLGTSPYVGPSIQTARATAGDVSLGTAYFAADYLTYDTGGNAVGTAGYYGVSLNTYQPFVTLPLNLPPMNSTVQSATVETNLLRWGQDGLAIATSTGYLYLIRGPAVVPQLLSVSTAATLTSGSPITHGTTNTLITLTGTNFQPGVAVTWNGSYRTTTIVDATHVSVAIPASDLGVAGTATVIATNPGAPASAPLTLTIN